MRIFNWITSNWWKADEKGLLLCTVLVLLLTACSKSEEEIPQAKVDYSTRIVGTWKAVDVDFQLDINSSFIAKEIEKKERQLNDLTYTFTKENEVVIEERREPIEDSFYQNKGTYQLYGNQLVLELAVKVNEEYLLSITKQNLTVSMEENKKVLYLTIDKTKQFKEKYRNLPFDKGQVEVNQVLITYKMIP